MKIHLPGISILTALSLSVSAQTGYPDAGGRANALGNASVALEDVFSAQNNPAGMDFVEETSLGLSTQNFFLLEDGINAFYAAGVLPVQRLGSFGLTTHYTGDPTFNQAKIGIGYGKKLAEALSIGIQLDLINTKIEEIGSGQAFTFDVGILYKPAKSLAIGARAFNPIRAENGMEYAEELPAIISAGIAWKLSDKVLLCAEGEQELNQDLRIKSGLEYHIIDALYLRGGYLSNPSVYTCGLGLSLKTFQLDASAQFHQQLGLSPGVGLRYTF